MIVVSDTSPIHYLLLINLVELLPQLYRRIAIPQIVRDEMIAAGAPEVLQQWVCNPPDWLDIYVVEEPVNRNLMRLDPGERALSETNFRVSPVLVRSLLSKHGICE
jgi:predicted nucleic acid-binding protein